MLNARRSSLSTFDTVVVLFITLMMTMTLITVIMTMKTTKAFTISDSLPVPLIRGHQKPGSFVVKTTLHGNNRIPSGTMGTETTTTTTTVNSHLHAINGLGGGVDVWTKQNNNNSDVVLVNGSNTTLAVLELESSSSGGDNNNSNNNNDDDNDDTHEKSIQPHQKQGPGVLQQLIDEIPFGYLFRGREGREKLPPMQVEDTNVLFYDVFLIVNLSLSISIWVTHRLDVTYLPVAMNEGCLFSLLWICAGLYHGCFLYSAIDGHYPMNSEKAGPRAAAALAFNTYINAMNLRLVAALLGAWLQHRQVGMTSLNGGDSMEQLIPLEMACGLVLMPLWRALHSSYTPRI
jgi:hypothetical protein